MRMPVLAPAQVRGRRLLVDGSLIDNPPLSTLAALGEGPLITVDVKAGARALTEQGSGGTLVERV